MKLYARARVVATSAITWLTIAAAALTAGAGVLTNAAVVDGLGASETVDTVAAWSLRIAGALAAIVAMIRRVTPVGEDQRGLLPAQPPNDVLADLEMQHE